MATTLTPKRGAVGTLAQLATTPSGGVAIQMPDGSYYPLTGTLLSVTTLHFGAGSSGMISTNGVIPFDTKLRDDLNIGDVTANIGRIAIPAAAKQIRFICGLNFNASEGGTYRRVNFNIAAAGTTLTAITTPSLYSGFKPSTSPVIGTQAPSIVVVSSLVDVSAWPVPAALGDSYIELKAQHDGTAGSGAQVSVQQGSFFSLEVYS